MSIIPITTPLPVYACGNDTPSYTCDAFTKPGVSFIDTEQEAPASIRSTNAHSASVPIFDIGISAIYILPNWARLRHPFSASTHSPSPSMRTNAVIEALECCRLSFIATSPLQRNLDIVCVATAFLTRLDNLCEFCDFAAMATSNRMNRATTRPKG